MTEDLIVTIGILGTQLAQLEIRDQNHTIAILGEPKLQLSLFLFRATTVKLVISHYIVHIKAHIWE